MHLIIKFVGKDLKKVSQTRPTLTVALTFSTKFLANFSKLGETMGGVHNIN